MKNLSNTLSFILILCPLASPCTSCIFEEIPNKIISSYANFYAKVQTDSHVNCIAICTLNSDCVFVSFQYKTCKLFKIIQTQYFIDSSENTLYKKKDNRFEKLMIGLQNYWPIINNTHDIVGGAHMYGPVNAGTTNDRFNIPNSAIHLNYGYYRLPSGVYLNGDFTLTAWVFVNAATWWIRLFDFGNQIGPGRVYSDVLSFYLTIDYDLTPGFVTWPHSNHLKSSVLINLNQWYHVAFSLKGTLGSVYINGLLTDQKTQPLPLNVVRESSLIGGSVWSDPLPNVIYDELRIFNRALDAAEIFDIMNL